MRSCCDDKKSNRNLSVALLHECFQQSSSLFFFFKATEGELMAEHLTLSQSGVASPVLVSSPARSRLWPSHRRCLFFRRSVDPVGLEEFTWAEKPLRILPPEEHWRCSPTGGAVTCLLLELGPLLLRGVGRSFPPDADRQLYDNDCDHCKITIWIGCEGSLRKAGVFWLRSVF